MHPEPDIWLATSISTTTCGLDGASLAAPGEERGGGVWDEEADAASGAGEDMEAAAAAVSSDASAPNISLTSLWDEKNDGKLQYYYIPLQPSVQNEGGPHRLQVPLNGWLVINSLP